MSNTPGDIIKTLGLGSCIAVMAVHGASGAIGMVHIVLPESKTDPFRAQSRPGYFADTAITTLFDEMNRLTGSTGRYLVKLAGGASVLTNAVANDTMNIGKRNILATKKALWKRGLGALAEDVGGTGSRSVSLSHGNVKVEITNGGKTLAVI